MAAVYPGAIVSWTQRINGETVWAADPNALAAEVTAIETYLGGNPQIEHASIAGSVKTFNTTSERISAAMLQNGHPFVEISRSDNWGVLHSTNATHTGQNPFNTVTASWPNYTNAGTIVIQDTGFWVVNATQRWAPASSGWVMMNVLSNGSVLRRDIFSYSQFPSSGSNTYGERFLNQEGFTDSTYLGRLVKGTVLSVASGNFTNVNPLNVHSMNLSAYYIRP